MRKISLCYVWVLLAALFVGCDSSSTTEEGSDSDSEKATLPKAKGDYTVATGKVGNAIDLSNLKGTINLEKEGKADGATKMKLTLSDFEGSMGGKKTALSSLAFDVTLEKAAPEFYKVTFAKQDIEKDVPLNLIIPLSGATNTALGLSASLSGIELVSTSKNLKYTTTVEPLKDAVEHEKKKYLGVVVTNKSKKVEIKIGAKVTVKVTIELTDAELLDSIKDTAKRASLKAIYNYPGSDPSELVKKIALKTLITNFIEQYKAGVANDPIELVLTATKK